MDKKFTIATVPVKVDASRVPGVYRIDFTGAATNPDAVEIPYDAADKSRVVTFPVAGDYVATAGLYDANGVLLGTTSSVSFNVANGGDTKEVNAVSGVTIEDVPVPTPTVASRLRR